MMVTVLAVGSITASTTSAWSRVVGARVSTHVSPVILGTYWLANSHRMIVAPPVILDVPTDRRIANLTA